MYRDNHSHSPGKGDTPLNIRGGRVDNSEFPHPGEFGLHDLQFVLRQSMLAYPEVPCLAMPNEVFDITVGSW